MGSNRPLDLSSRVLEQEENHSELQVKAVRSAMWLALFLAQQMGRTDVSDGLLTLIRDFDRSGPRHDP